MNNKFSITSCMCLLAHESHNKYMGDIKMTVICCDISSNIVISPFPSNSSIPAEKLMIKKAINTPK